MPAPIWAVKLPSTAVTRLLFCFGLFPLIKLFLHLDFFKINKVTLIQWDSFFTVTLSLLGSISYLYRSVLWSENCMIVKACSRNITDYAATPVYKENINLKVPGVLFFAVYLRSSVKKSRLSFPTFQEDVVLPTLP